MKLKSLLLFFIVFIGSSYSSAIATTLTSVSPSNNSSTVSSTTTIQVTFSQGMKTSSFNDSTSFLVNGIISGRHRGSFSFSSDSTVATFTPSSSFKKGEKVIVNITNNIKDNSNNSITPFQYSFSVQPDSSQGIFATRVNYTTGNGPLTPFISDVDSDGDGDLAVINQSSSSVSILKNNGDGTFATKVDYTTGSSPQYVSMADMDLDGDADLVVASTSANTISTLMNNGDGTFATKVDYSTGSGSNPSFLAVGDLSGDGYPDVAAVDNNTDSVSIFINDGDGTLAAEVNYKTGDLPYAITIHDVDEDGDEDLVILNRTAATISILKNNGDGTFAAKVDYSTGSTPREVCVADFDGDSDADIAVTNGGNNNVSILMNNGDGTFATRVNYTTGNSPFGVTSGDVNGDGFTDLAVVNGSSSTISILKNNGDGTFATKVDSATGSNPRRVVIGDLNADNINDIVVVNNSNNNISVYLGIKQYKLTMNATNGTVSKNPDQTWYDSSTSVILTPTPASNYYFTGWSGDLSGAESPDTIIMNTHKTVTANFSLIIDTITASAGANGSISPSGAVLVNRGNATMFTFTPATGYHVDSIIVDGVKVDSLLSYTFNDVTTNHTIRVVFVINIYNITASAGDNGTISPSGIVSVNYNSSQTYSITPSSGYHTDSLIVDGSPVTPDTSYTFSNVNANHTIRAVFANNIYTITSSAGANGSISPSGSVSVNYNSNQTFSITPITNYHVDSLIVDGSIVTPDTSYTFINVSANHTIRAVFAINTFVINATAGASGTISPSGNVSVIYDANRSFSITPNIGYHIDSLIVDGSPVTPDTNYTFSNVNANHTILVVFKINTFVINATAGANGTITPSGNLPVNYNANQSFSITPSANYHVDSLIVDGLSVTPDTSYTFNNVMANHSIRAVFKINPAQFSVSPNSLSFGNVVLGQTKLDSVTVTNTGGVALSITNVSSVNSQYSISPTSASVNPSGTVKFYITFAPASSVESNGTISFTHDAVGSPGTVSASGTGIAPIYNMSPTSLSFGNLSLNTSKTDSVTISNTGTSLLTISSASSNSNLFSISPSSGSVNSGGGTMKFYITYTPTAISYDHGTITFIHDAVGSQDSLTLSGTGYAATFSVSPTSLSFGDVKPLVSKTDSVTVSNSGTAPLTISSVSSSTGKITVTPTSATINKNTSQKFYITFTPTVTGSKTGTITFTHNATGSPSKVTTSGRGAEAQFSSSKTSIAFPSLSLGETSKDTIIISNAGNLTLNMTSIVSSSSQFLVSASSATVSANSTKKIYVTFTPTDTGAKSGTITIHHDATGSPFVLSVTGTVGSPAFATSPASLNFGSVYTTKPKQDSVVISNGGTAQLIITNIASNNALFSVTPTSASINPAATAKFYITYSPTDTSSSSGSVTFSHNASGSPSSFPVSGRGYVSPGNAIQFTGTGTNPVFATYPFTSLTTEFTIATWIYNDAGISYSGERTIITADKTTKTPFDVRFDDSRIIFEMDASNSVSTNINLYDNKWHHIVVTAKSGSALELYIDGELMAKKVASISFTDVQQYVNAPLSIGSSNTVEAYRGKMDELSIWSKQLSAATIKSLMYNSIFSTNENYSYLLSYYKFDEQSGSSTTDNKGGSSASIPTQASFILSDTYIDKPALFFETLVNFGQVLINTGGKTVSTTIRAGYGGANITSISSTNPLFSISPSSLTLTEGEIKVITMLYNPTVISSGGGVDTGTIVLSTSFGNKIFSVQGTAFDYSDFNNKNVYSMATNDTLNVNPFATLLPNDFTVSLTSKGSKFIFNIGTDIQIERTNDSITINRVSKQVLPTKTKSGWVHTSIVFSGNTAKVYENGYFQNNLQFTGTMSFPTNPTFRIISDNSTYIDNVSLWSEGLSENEIKKLKYFGEATYLTEALSTLLGYYDFEEGIDSLVRDKSGNNRHATESVNRSTPGITVGTPIFLVNSQVVDSLNFGTRKLNSDSTITISLLNTGNQSLSLSSIITSDTMFKTTFTDTSQLAAGSSRNFTVKYLSTQYAEFSGTFTIENNANISTQTLYLTGKTSDVGKLTIGTTSLKMGNTVVGATKVSSIYVKNTTSVPVNILNIYESYRGDPLFSITQTSRTSQPGKYDTIKVNFSPDSLTEYSSSFHKINIVTENAGRYAIPISGNGIYGGNLSVPVTELDLSNTPALSSKSATATITNSGTGNVTGIQYSSSNSLVTVSGPSSLGLGLTGTVSAVFLPSNDTSFSGKIYISFNRATSSGGVLRVVDSSITFVATSIITLITDPGNMLKLYPKKSTSTTVSDYIASGAQGLEVDSAFTIQFWMQYDANKPSTPILSKTSSSQTSPSISILTQSGKLYIVKYKSSTQHSYLTYDFRTENLGTIWRFIAVTWKYQDSLKLYIDGILARAIGTNEESFYGNPADELLYLGGQPLGNLSSTTPLFNIDELQIWDYAKTEDEIEVELSEGFNNLTGLKAYFNFDEATTEMTLYNQIRGGGNLTLYDNNARVIPSTLDLSAPDIGDEEFASLSDNYVPKNTVGDVYRGDETVTTKSTVSNKGGRAVVVKPTLTSDTTGGTPALSDESSNIKIKKNILTTTDPTVRTSDKTVVRAKAKEDIEVEYTPKTVNKKLLTSNSSGNFTQQPVVEKKTITIETTKKNPVGGPPLKQTKPVANVEGRTLPVDMTVNVGKTTKWEGLDKEVPENQRYNDTVRVRVTPKDNIKPDIPPPPPEERVVVNGKVSFDDVEYTKADVELLAMNTSKGDGKFVSNTSPKKVEVSLLKDPPDRDTTLNSSRPNPGGQGKPPKPKQKSSSVNFAVSESKGMHIPPFGFRYHASSLYYTDPSLWGGALPIDTSDIIIAYPGYYDLYNVHLDLTQLNEMGTEVRTVKSLVVVDSAEFTINGSGEYNVLEQMTIHGNVTLDADSTATITLGGLYIDGNFTIPEGKNPTLIINGNLTIDGTFEQGNSTIILNGSGKQILTRTGSDSVHLQFNNLIVNNDSSVISNTTTINGKLTLNANLAIGKYLVPTVADSNGNQIVLEPIFNVTSDTLIITSVLSDALDGEGRITSGIVKRTINQIAPATYRFYDAFTTIQTISTESLPASITMTKLGSITGTDQHVVLKNGVANVSAKNVTVENVNPNSTWLFASSNYQQGDETGGPAYSINSEGLENYTVALSLGYEVSQLNGFEESALALVKVASSLFIQNFSDADGNSESQDDRSGMNMEVKLYKDSVAEDNLVATQSGSNFTFNDVGGGTFILVPSTTGNSEVINRSLNGEAYVDTIESQITVTLEEGSVDSASFVYVRTVGITADSVAYGTINPEGVTVIPLNGTVTYSFIPDAGYRVKDVAVDGISLGAIDEYRFEGVTETHIVTAEFVIDDNVLFRTFASTTELSSNPIKLKYSKSGQVNAAPNLTTAVEAVFKKLGKNGVTFLGIAQPQKDSAKKYGWIAYKTRSELGKLFTATTTGKAYPIDTVRVKKPVFLKGIIKADRKKYNNPVFEQGVLFKLNLLASQHGITPPNFGALVLDTNAILFGKNLSSETLTDISVYLDSIVTYWKKYEVDDSIAYAELGSFIVHVIKPINEAFYAPISASNYAVDSVGIVVDKNPFDITLAGVARASDARIVRLVTGTRAKQIQQTIGFEEVPEQFALYQNYPNPFNPSTTIEFEIPATSFVTLKVFNILGQLVTTLLHNEQIEAGKQTIEFDASDFASGVYFYKLESSVVNNTGPQSFLDVKKMLLVR